MYQWSYQIRKPSIPYMDILNFQEMMSVKKWNVTSSESLITIFNFCNIYTGNMTYCKLLFQHRFMSIKLCYKYFYIKFYHIKMLIIKYWIKNSLKIVTLLKLMKWKVKWEGKEWGWILSKFISIYETLKY